MPKTVSARIPNNRHDELRERCNELGCSINEYLDHAIEFALDGSTEFDFDIDDSNEPTSNSIKTLDVPKENNSEKEIPKVKITKVSNDGGKTWINYE